MSTDLIFGKAKYTVPFTCVCPNDKEVIEYEAVLTSDKVIMVEDIISFVKSFKDKSLYQEDITDKISLHFNCSVCTFGTHQGVFIRCKVKKRPMI